MVRGGYSSIFDSLFWLIFAFIVAPIILKGAVTRSIGLTERDLPAVKVTAKFCPAKTPNVSRIVVPEPPTKIGPLGFFRPQSPLPNTVIVLPRREVLPIPLKGRDLTF